MDARPPSSNIAAVDLFCGVGGLTRGLEEAGIPVAAGIDVDGSCRFAFEQNNEAQFIESSVSDVEVEDLRRLYPKDHVRVLVGCAPCRPYSSASARIAEGKREWDLLEDFADLIEGVEPDVISMENVTRLRSFKGGEVFRRFVRRLGSCGYIPSVYHVFCPDYGVPQRRRRLVFFASKYGPVSLAPPTHSKDDYATVADAIASLPPIGAGEASETDPLHRARSLSAMNRVRMEQSRPGGTWDDWDEELVADCHKKSSGASYRSVYGRMEWTEPSPTITTQFYSFGSGRFGHPEQDRALTLREGAILQTFPSDYEFVASGEPVHFATLGRHIGNAVPVALGRVIGESIRLHLDDYA